MQPNVQTTGKTRAANAKCAFSLRRRGGSILVPALFLLILFIALGGAMLGISQMGLGIGKTSIAARQAYYTAKSGLDMVVNALTGDYTINASVPEPFKSLNNLIEPLAKGASVSGTGNVAGDVKLTIACTDKTQDAKGTVLQTIFISSTAENGPASRTVSRTMTLERKKAGKLENGIIGAGQGNGFEANYNIRGLDTGNNRHNAVINGGLRIENAQNFAMHNVTVEGDLYIMATGQIDLNDVVVTGTVFLESKSGRIVLENCKAEGDCVFSAPSAWGRLVFNRYFITDGDVYIKTPANSIWIPNGNRDAVVAQNFYLAPPSGFSGGNANSVSGSIITGTLGAAAYDAKYQQVNKDNTEIRITMPDTFTQEEEITPYNLAKFYRDYPVLDTGDGGTLDFKLSDVTLPLMTEIRVAGTGTVNFYSDIGGIFNPAFRVIREDGAPTVVNFVSPDTNNYYLLAEMLHPLEANIFVPHGGVFAINAPITGITVAADYQLFVDKNEDIIIWSSAPWANSGSLSIGNVETVKGVAGEYQ